MKCPKCGKEDRVKFQGNHITMNWSDYICYRCIHMFTVK